ncbi:MAG: hypothetical protein R2715_16350 [Ilumatobacteraceae bacterium]
MVWAEVVALGPNVRAAEPGDRVLFSPDDRYEVEVGGQDYIMLRERDLHAVAAEARRGLDRPVPLIVPARDPIRSARGGGSNLFVSHRTRPVAWRSCPPA